MTIAFCIFAVLCLINISMVSSQQVPGLFSTKKCAQFELVPMSNFHKEIYSGTWFMHQMFDVPNTISYNCYVLLTTPYPNGSVNVTEILLGPGLLPELRTDGVSTFSSDGKGIITYTSPDLPQYNGVYYVLKTDYLTYTVEVACTDVSGGSRIQLYIMVRTPLVFSFIQKNIDAVIIASKLDRSKIRTLDITTCPASLIEGGGLLAGLFKLLANVLGGLLGGLLELKDYRKKERIGWIQTLPTDEFYYIRIYLGTVNGVGTKCGGIRNVMSLIILPRRKMISDATLNLLFMVSSLPANVET